MIALGCDHGGINLKTAIMKYLDEKGIEYKDFGCYSEDSVDYPIYAYKVEHSLHGRKSHKRRGRGEICRHLPQYSFFW